MTENPKDDGAEAVAKELADRWERFKQVLRSGCKCLTDLTTGETAECEVCRKARENIQ